MRAVSVLIIGGGPAGATCAETLKKAGVDCLILDKAEFPRPKACAGWLTPDVIEDLVLDPDDYPYSLSTFSHLKIYFRGWPLIRPGKQYAIRRVEFDAWLLKRSGAEVIQHDVKKISRLDGKFLVDDQFSAEYLVGAGGTHCPVKRLVFKDQPVRTGSQIVSLEEEYEWNWVDSSCRLWFFRENLPGYAWYVPKIGGYVNIGIGANAAALIKSGKSIQDHWESLVNMLVKSGKIQQRTFQPEGYTYYLKGAGQQGSLGKAILIGDSLGLATLDMGEGIGPAVKSGIEAARSIIEGRPYDISGLPDFSLLPGSLGWLLRKQVKEI